MACNCPKPAAPTAITATSCPEDIGQIQRVWLVRKGNVVFDTTDPTTAKQIPAAIALAGYTPDTVEPWDVLKVSGDSTQVVFTPLFGGDITITPSDPVFQGGGDNSTLNGQAYYVNTPDSTFSARFDQLTPTQTSEIKDLKCEDMEVYFINEDGDIIGQRDKTDSDLFKGIPVTSIVLGSRNVQGFTTRDSNLFTFQLNEDWDTYFEKITPTNFNALTY